MAMPQCCYLAKGAKRPSHTTNTIKFDRIPFDPSNSIKRFDLCPFDQKNSTYLQPPVLNYKMANWEEISIQLENIMVENMDSMITEAPTKDLLIFMGLVRGVCENSIPRKTLCKYSKPYWSNKFTHSSKKLKDARKKYRLQCNLKNKTIVEMAKIEFKKEMKMNNTRWTQNGIMEMNEGNSKTFFDNICKFNGGGR